MQTDRRPRMPAAAGPVARRDRSWIPAGIDWRSRSLPSLLAEDERPAFRIENPTGRSPVVLTCDHASHSVPRSLGTLGVDARDLRRHIGWDIGAANVAIRLARRLDAPAVLSGYSRLVIDCNRRLGSPASIVESSDGVRIPGNAGIGPKEASRRAATLFVPYHRAISRELECARQRGPEPVYVAIHSFTSQLDGGPPRPWHFGVLWDRDPRIAVPLIKALRANPGISVGDNEPYSARDHFDFSQEHHATTAGLPSALVEIREDLIRDEQGVARLAGLLGDALETALAAATPALGAR